MRKINTYYSGYQNPERIDAHMQAMAPHQEHTIVNFDGCSCSAENFEQLMEEARERL